MRLFYGMLLAGSLVLGQASFARAQTNAMNSFGGYPAGVTTGSPSPYGLYSSGSYGLNYGYPFIYHTDPYAYYGSRYLAPNASLYNPGTGPTYGGFSTPGAYNRGYNALNGPGSYYNSTAYPRYSSSYSSPGYVRSGGAFTRYRWRGW